MGGRKASTQTRQEALKGSVTDVISQKSKSFSLQRSSSRPTGKGLTPQYQLYKNA